MSIRTRLFQALAKSISPFLPRQELYSPDHLITGFSYPGEENNLWSDYSYENYERLAITSPLVKPNIDILGNSVARSILEMQEVKDLETDTWQTIKNHPFDRFMNKSPMPGMGATFAWKYQIQWLMLRGEAYWMIVPNGFNELLMLIPIPANMIKPIPWKEWHGGEPRLISCFAYTPKDPQYPERLETHQVVFHKLPNPFNPIRGLSPLSVYLMMLKTVTEADKFDLDDYVHGLTLSKIVSLKTDMNNSDFAKALADWERARLEGARFRIFRGGDIDVKDLTTRRGEDGKSIHERAKMLADRVWSIPEGLRDMNATEASATVANMVYQRETIMPLLDLLSEDLNAQVVEKFYGDNIRCAFQSTVPDDVDSLLKQKQESRKAKTFDEVRYEEGLDPYEDKEIGKIPFMALTEAMKVKLQSQLPKVVDVNKDIEIDEPELEGKAVLKPKGKPLSDMSVDAISELLQKEIDDYVIEFNRRNPQLDGLLEASVNGKGE